jgi:DNA-binding MarR family transcriptional regulator
MISLTPEGTALHRDLRDAIGRTTCLLLQPIAASDLETTIRTMQQITERAGTLHAPGHRVHLTSQAWIC